MHVNRKTRGAAGEKILFHRFLKKWIFKESLLSSLMKKKKGVCQSPPKLPSVPEIVHPMILHGYVRFWKQSSFFPSASHIPGWCSVLTHLSAYLQGKCFYIRRLVTKARCGGKNVHTKNGIHLKPVDKGVLRFFLLEIGFFTESGLICMEPVIWHGWKKKNFFPTK